MFLAVLLSSLRITHLFKFRRIYLLFILSKTRLLRSRQSEGMRTVHLFPQWDVTSGFLVGEGDLRKARKKKYLRRNLKLELPYYKANAWKAPSRRSVPDCPALSISSIMKRSCWYLQINEIDNTIKSNTFSG